MKQNRLGMKEVVVDFTGKQVGATFFRGTEPIDGVWEMADLKITNACIMMVGCGVGDHCLFVVEFTVASVVGSVPPPIV